MDIPEYYYPTLGSTMDRARELSRDDPREPAFWVRTSHQTSGRGRRDRRWEDTSGQALLVTLAVRRGGTRDPGDAPAATIALRAAAAVWDLVSVTVGEASPHRCSIKWPNDILLSDRKVCGILVEADSRWFRIGVGLNVRGAPAVLDNGLKATSLSDHVPRVSSPEALFPLLARRMASYLIGSDWHAVVDRALAWRGCCVVVEEEDRLAAVGVVVGIASDGGLLLDTGGASGGITVYSGTVRLNRGR